MRKIYKTLCLFLVMVMMASIVTGCGNKEEQEKKPQEKGEKIILINNTDRDLKGEIFLRHKHKDPWTKLTSKSKQWHPGQKIEITVKGKMPKAKDGWDMKLVFDDTGEVDIWSGVPIGKAKVLSITQDGVDYTVKKK